MDSPPPQRLTTLGGNNSVSSISHQSESAGRRPVTKKRTAHLDRGGSRKAQKLARSSYATWRQDPYLDRDKDEEAFPVGNDEDIFEDGLGPKGRHQAVIDAPRDIVAVAAAVGDKNGVGVGHRREIEPAKGISLPAIKPLEPNPGHGI